MSGMALLTRLAAYNRWVNDKLYATCAAVADVERRRDRGVFFRSVHGTLNHLLLADRLWLGRLRGEPCAATDLGAELYADFDELRAQRRISDAAIAAYVRDLPEAALARTLTYVSVATGARRSCSYADALLQLFNHQTHHRGQLTALLSQLGCDYGDIDLIWMRVG
jgi:uncharacterized damage-inducible protein DinB